MYNILEKSTLIFGSGSSWCTTYHSHHSNKIKTIIVWLGELPGKNGNLHLTSKKDFWAWLGQYSVWFEATLYFDPKADRLVNKQPKSSVHLHVRAAVHSPLPSKHFSLSSSGSCLGKTTTTIWAKENCCMLNCFELQNWNSGTPQKSPFKRDIDSLLLMYVPKSLHLSLNL